MAKILVTGATGFIGKRLILDLLDKNHEVYALCRVKGSILFADEKPNFHIIWGDLRNPETLTTIPKEIEVAYYLVHSMTDIMSNLVDIEIEVAKQFINGIKDTQVKQIIYLGGIINDEQKLSTHLRSRLLVESVLKESGIPTTILRASIIIGAGSASFEIIRDLCEKLPIMVAPKWINSLCQPIAIGDVLFYLSSVILNEKCFNKVFDIGGPEILSFKELLLEYAQFRQLKRKIIDVPVLTPRLSSYWLVFITSVRFSLCYYLVESMETSSVANLNEIKQTFPHSCMTYREALALSFQKIAQNEVVSTWMDSWDIEGDDPNLSHYIQVPTEGCIRDIQKVIIEDSKEATIERIWRIGGHAGYYVFNWAWNIRGMIDRMMGGIGRNIGRKHPEQIQVGDSIDFWRVLVADKANGHLILFAAMKLPGEAWLEFKVDNIDNEWMLVQTATFRPSGVSGRIYWYSLYPFHFFIFQGMAKALAGSKKHS